MRFILLPKSIVQQFTAVYSQDWHVAT